ncbi:MAG TPA: PD-(D/E)XK nuclease family protein [Vicinamibacterales bacterium]
MTSTRLIESSSAPLRLDAARAFVRERTGRSDVWIVAASRGAADDLTRAIAVEAGATIGIHRFSLAQLALHLAGPVLASEGLAPVTSLGFEAVAARAVFGAQRDGVLTYFGPVARTPGFPRALARTAQELRQAAIPPDRLGRLPLGGPDLAGLLDRVDAQFTEARATDRALLLEAATRALTLPAAGSQLSTAGVRFPALLLLDVAIDSAASMAFVAALLAASADTLITLPFGDVATLDRLAALGVTPEILEPSGDEDLVALRRYLFAKSQPPERQAAGDVRLFSAPGEGRECVEIARRILQEARRGVPLDEIAVFVRSPERYVGLLEDALRRAIPDESGQARAWFDRGVVRPAAAGRAFLALLDCACEGLSARRFAEYLSLGQVPKAAEASRAVPPALADAEEAMLEGPYRYLTVADEDAPALEPPPDLPGDARDEGDPDEGTLAQPWKWESLIVESSVIGGDAERWRRRLKGLERKYEIQIAAELKKDALEDSPKAQRITRDFVNLGHLSRFALPIVESLAGWPARATWGEWLQLFEALVPRVLREPGSGHVRRALRQLNPMSDVGPITLGEARGVLADTLRTFQPRPPRSRYGRVFVGGPEQARGRTFRVVFVAGLAERMFPQRPHEDPMLLDDEMRAPLAAGLALQEDRARAERLLLRLAVGAPTERLWLSYPRLEAGESRPRVPSFYVLDVMRAITGRIPPPAQLQAAAFDAGGAGLAWPAPASPADAIDDVEHDLAVLRELMQIEPRARVRGQAHYLLRLNEALKRSVSARWARGRSSWTPFDGITRVTGMTKPALDKHRLTARPYSLSALQKYAACPYQFLLSAVHRLEPPPDIEPLQKLDPLTRGSIFHEIQTRLFRTLRERDRLPVTAAQLPEVVRLLDETVKAVAARYRDRLAPAIDRVWRDEIADLARDLRVWIRRIAVPAAAAGQWRPAYFEFAFGLKEEFGEDVPPRDPASRRDPATIDGRFTLRGSVDLIETRGQELRITDHKTGKNRTTAKTVIGGGAILQPVLYSLAIEQGLGATVASGRLFYCTSAGGFTDHEIPLNEQTRRSGVEALEIVDRAIELGFLPAAPAERACTWCDFLPVCGPDEPRRVRHKSPDRLGDLDALREKP